MLVLEWFDSLSTTSSTYYVVNLVLVLVIGTRGSTTSRRLLRRCYSYSYPAETTRPFKVLYLHSGLIIDLDSNVE